MWYPHQVEDLCPHQEPSRSSSRLGIHLVEVRQRPVMKGIVTKLVKIAKLGDICEPLSCNQLLNDMSLVSIYTEEICLRFQTDPIERSFNQWPSDFKFS